MVHTLEMPYHWGTRRLETRCRSKVVQKRIQAKLEEYMQNAWISISAPTMLIHIHCAFSDEISIQVLGVIIPTPATSSPVRCSATILHLDLGTSTDELARGDVLKSVQCYMHETGASQEEARE
ncbi:hypothetical protein ARALYDRAFT_904756 [Arabidopsis lyrata subsp. lyrata]|uniref:Terpene synthase metal-binding domain-containing protein n=1 Tax=Arabidopsis lyrata subsp. lyrata TaxID=81972 RepID=D7LQV4_ARALL|nr:hypothetical protein ARALYDRAFT_904756 [Arabidopsis lyrata subsp. lyrata]